MTERIPCYEPNTFGGGPSEDVHSFFKRYELVALANSWNDQRKLQLLPFYIKDTAELVLEQIKRKYGVDLSWDIVVDNFKKTFAQVVNIFALERQLISRVQHPNETFVQYMANVEHLCYLVDEGMSETRICSHILKGLNPEILQKISMLDNSSRAKIQENVNKFEQLNLLLQYRLETDSFNSHHLTKDALQSKREDLTLIDDQLNFSLGKANGSYCTNYNRSLTGTKEKNERGLFCPNDKKETCYQSSPAKNTESVHDQYMVNDLSDVCYLDKLKPSREYQLKKQREIISFYKQFSDSCRHSLPSPRLSSSQHNTADDSVLTLHQQPTTVTHSSVHQAGIFEFESSDVHVANNNNFQGATATTSTKIGNLPPSNEEEIRGSIGTIILVDTCENVSVAVQDAQIDQQQNVPIISTESSRDVDVLKQLTTTTEESLQSSRFPTQLPDFNKNDSSTRVPEDGIQECSFPKANMFHPPFKDHHLATLAKLNQEILGHSKQSKIQQSSRTPDTQTEDNQEVLDVGAMTLQRTKKPTVKLKGSSDLEKCLFPTQDTITLPSTFNEQSGTFANVFNGPNGNMKLSEKFNLTDRLKCEEWTTRCC